LAEAASSARQDIPLFVCGEDLGLVFEFTHGQGGKCCGSSSLASAVAKETAKKSKQNEDGSASHCNKCQIGDHPIKVEGVHDRPQACAERPPRFFVKEAVPDTKPSMLENAQAK